jgi:poly(beta-D-mannuronate) lyase
VRDLDLQRYYSDREGSVVDPGKLAAQRNAVAPIKEFLQHVVADADRGMRAASASGRRDNARCAVMWLAGWAREGALLGQIVGAQSEAERKWDFTGAAMAYLKVKPYATVAERSAIEGWLERLATAARAYFDDPHHARNNHWYWLGLGLGATAIATGSEARWAQAREVMADAARDIAADGSLPKELARRGRALHYHAFAVTPLVALAELAAARGEDWYGLGDGALHRLVSFTVRGLIDSSRVEALAGVAQEVGPSTASAGWLPLYVARFPGRLQGPLPVARPNHRWLGGDTRLLGVALGRL